MADTPELAERRARLLQQVRAMQDAPVADNEEPFMGTFDQIQKGKLESSARGAGVTRAIGQGLTFGFGDEIMGGVRGGLDALTSDKSFPDAYGERLAAERQALGQFREAHPVASTVAEVAGALPTALLGPLSWGARAVQGGRLARAGASALGGAAGGGTYGFGAGEGGARRRLEGAVLPAALGGGIGAVAPAVGKAVGSLVGTGAKKRGGLPDKEIIARAPSTEALKTQSGAAVRHGRRGWRNNSIGCIRQLSRHRRGPDGQGGSWTRSVLHPKASSGVSRRRFDSKGRVGPDLQKLQDHAAITSGLAAASNGAGRTPHRIYRH